MLTMKRTSHYRYGSGYSKLWDVGNLLQFDRNAIWQGILVFQPLPLPRDTFILYLFLEDNKSHIVIYIDIQKTFLWQCKCVLAWAALQPQLSHIWSYALFAGFSVFLYCRCVDASSVLLSNHHWSLHIAGCFLVAAGRLGDSCEQTQIDLHQEGSRRPEEVPRTLGWMLSLLRVLVACFVRLLGTLCRGFASYWWDRRWLVRLSRTLGGAGARVGMSHTASRTLTIHDLCDVRLGCSLPLVQRCVFRSPFNILFRVTAVLAFLAVSCFRLYFGSICETRVFVSCGYNFLTLNTNSCTTAIGATFLCWFWGVRVARQFPDISGRGFLATLLVTVVLMGFSALLGCANIVNELFLVRRKLRLGLPAGVDHLYTEVPGVLSGQELFVSGAPGDMSTTLSFSAWGLLVGPDKSTQLPVTMGHRWSFRL